MKVLFLPFYEENPYQRLLYAALRTMHVEAFPIRGVIFMPAVWRVRPRVIHLHWLDLFCNRGSWPRSLLAFGAFLVQWPWLRLAGTRIVWTAHNIGNHEGSWRSADRVLNRMVARDARRIIVHCEDARERFLSAHPKTPRGRVIVVPHGSYVGAYPCPIEQQAARRSLGLATDGRVLLFLGHLRDYKGIRELVQRFLEDPALASTRLVVAGRARDPALAGDLRGAAARSGNIVLHLGLVADERIPIYMAAADAMVLPFRKVLASGSFILALSFGKAVIAPRTGCITELSEQAAGFFYDPDDPAGLQTALRRFAAGDGHLADMGRQNRTLAESLSWEVAARLTRDAYSACD